MRPDWQLETLISKVKEQQSVSPAALTVHPGTAEPVEVSLGRAGTIYANPYTGDVLAKSQVPVGVSERNQSRARTFFRTMEDWHRWLGAFGGNRTTGKSHCGRSELRLFRNGAERVFLVDTTQNLNWQNIRPSLWFRWSTDRRSLGPGTWHNVIGIWCWVPLVLSRFGSGVIMSYTWASNLLYTATGSPLPPQFGPGPRGGNGGRGAVCQKEEMPRASQDQLRARRLKAGADPNSRAGLAVERPS